MSKAGLIETLARLVGDALGPLSSRLSGDGAEEVLAEIGLRLPTGALGASNVPQALQASASASSQLPPAVADLIAAIGGNDDSLLLAAALTLAQRIAQSGAAFQQLGDALDTVVQGAAGLTAPQKTRLSEIAKAAPARLLHLAVMSFLEERQPTLNGALTLSGILDKTQIDGDPTDASLPPHHRRTIRFDRITSLFKDPFQHLKDLYGFGRPDFDGVELFKRVKAMVDRPDAEAILITAPGVPAVLEALIFRLAVEPGPIPALRIRVRLNADKDFNETVPIAGPWSATVISTARFRSGLEFVLDPQTGLHIEPPAADASLALTLGLTAANADSTPMILIGQVGGSRLEVGRFAARVPIQLKASAASPSPNSKLGAEVEIKQGKLVIDASKGDGFISKLLSGVKVESAFDVGALYDLDKGLRFTGSATIEIALPTHITLGPITIPNLYLIGTFKDGAIPVEFSADLGANLGPLAATVSRLGAIANISFPKGGGNAGPLQIDVGFKAPNGVGLSIDAGVIKGGGFLYVDPERGEYAGALELTFAQFLSLKAIGIITTRMPDGSSGFSLLLIITAEFGTGLQLGYGFTLLGVGGLLGLNRTMRLDALIEGVRTGGLSSVMFPKDVVANAPRIISDLRAFFPPKEGVFLIGPMAKLGWGTPTLISLSLGIIIEIPGNIALIGVLRVALPADEIAVVVLQVSFLGALEFDKSRAWFFATLFDSRVLFITIDGEMGLLLAFGDDANFVLAVGGFHPRFSPPPLPFGTPRRISIDVLNTPVARIRAEGYFATTTNSVQFGCIAESYFGFSALKVTGHIAFDALIRFSPFYFVVNFSSHFEVKVFGVGVWGLRIRLEVNGPTPWHAKGSAGISLLFFDIDVDIDVTWGERRDTSLPPLSLLPRLIEEFSKVESWRPLLPSGANLLVGLRKLQDAESRILFHPVGALRISQRFAPLNTTLETVGAQKTADANRFSLSVTSATFAKRADVNEPFAPAQFKNLSDNERLSRKAFEPMQGGIELSSVGQQLESGAGIVRIARYDLITIDTNARRHRRRFSSLASALFKHLVAGAAVARSALSSQRKKGFVPVEEGVKASPEGFAVVLQENNRALSSETANFASEEAARDWMATEVQKNRALTAKLQVIPQFEVVR